MDLVTIRTFQNYFSAHILLTRLRSLGIECYLKDEFTVTVNPVISGAIGGIKLIVKKENEEEACSILQQFDEEYMKSAVCPRCGNHTIELVPKKSPTNMATAIISWLFGNYALSAENVYQCASCKYESATLPETYHEDVSLSEPEILN
jgi:hypothetical protein